MPLHTDKSRFKLVIACSMLVCWSFSAKGEVVDLSFKHPPGEASDAERTLESLVTVRDIGEAYATGGLYLLTHYGDRDALFRAENQALMDDPMRDQTWRYCSLFSSTGRKDTIMGRNWDNQNVGSIIVSRYRPPGGHASISISRAVDMGFPLNVGLDDMVGSPFGDRLLLAPFFAMDGINEHGLAVAVAGVREAPAAPREGRELLFISYLIRKLLDRAATIDEAVSIADEYVPFLLDRNSVQGHLLVADASGRSVVLEYDNHQWVTVIGDTNWQALTNRPVFEVPDETLRETCWRYKIMAEALEKSTGGVDWTAGLGILKDVEQKGTTWSALYSLATREVHLSVYQDWDTVYHLSMAPQSP